jgi:dipeptidyl-peptidase III
MLSLRRLACVPLAFALLACKGEPASTQPDPAPAEELTDESLFVWAVDRFADAQVLRYQVPGFAELDLQRKQLLYYLYEAALAGRDITYDQKFAGNLAIRRTLEAIVRDYAGDRSSDEFIALHTYAKRVWFSNGIHHHYSGRKLEPGFSPAWFEQTVAGLDPARLPLRDGESVEQFLAVIGPMIFDPKLAAKRTNRDEGVDPVVGSANNFYGEGVTAKDVEDFYAKKIDKHDKTPISWGLNSKLVREGGQLVEQTWYAGGMYGPAIGEIVKWLNKARAVAGG